MSTSLALANGVNHLSLISSNLTATAVGLPVQLHAQCPVRFKYFFFSRPDDPNPNPTTVSISSHLDPFAHLDQQEYHVSH